MKTNFLDNILHKKKTYINEPQENNILDNFPKSENKPIKKQSVYENPTPINIRCFLRIKQSDLFIMHNLAFLAGISDKTVILGTPLRYWSHNQEYLKKFESDVEFTRRNVKKNLEACHKLENEANIQKELYNKIKTIYPDFGKNMNKKISEEDYNFYHNQVIKVKRVICDDKKYDKDTPASEIYLSALDKISSVIDSYDFTKACDIEDRFMISEFDIFFKKINEKSSDEIKTFRKQNIHTASGEKKSCITIAQEKKATRQKRLKKYEYVYTLYEKMKNCGKINFKVKTLSERNSDNVSVR